LAVGSWQWAVGKGRKKVLREGREESWQWAGKISKKLSREPNDFGKNIRYHAQAFQFFFSACKITLRCSNSFSAHILQ